MGRPIDRTRYRGNTEVMSPEAPAAPQAPPPRGEARKHLLLALVLLFLGVGGGVAFKAYRAGKAPEAPGMKAATPVGLTPQAGALWSRLAALLDSSDAGRFTFERLSQLLLKHKGDAAAKAFAAEFRKDPELQAVWEEFGNGQGGAAVVVRRLSQSVTFRELLNRYSQEPGFTSSGETLARDVEAELALNNPALVDRTQLLASAGPASLPAAEPRERRRDFRTAAGGAAAEVAAPEAAYAAREAASDQREHNVGRLEAIQSSGGDRQAVAFYASVFTQVEPQARARIQAELDRGHEPWKACERAGALGSCRQAWQRCQDDASCRNRISERGGPMHPPPPGPPDPPPGPVPTATSQLATSQGPQPPTTVQSPVGQIVVNGSSNQSGRNSGRDSDDSSDDSGGSSD